MFIEKMLADNTNQFQLNTSFNLIKIECLVKYLPADLDASIFVVGHMSPEGLVDWQINKEH
jgi:hypothetical protein